MFGGGEESLEFKDKILTTHPTHSLSHTPNLLQTKVTKLQNGRIKRGEYM